VIWDQIGWTDPDKRDAALYRLAADINQAVPTEGRDLSIAEVKVLVCLSHGLTMEMTAEMLEVGYETVASEARSARVKLGAKNTAHACARAIRQGLIP
jgi:DNA-binding CsgD family transcriptional regulator